MSTTSTSGWNRPQQNAPKVAVKKPSAMRGVVAGLVTVCALGGLCLWLFSGGDDAPKAKPDKERGRIKEVVPAKAQEQADEQTAYKERMKRVREELNDQVKEFVRKSPTNRINWIFKPLDPNDPDSAMRTSLARDISTLLAVSPGEHIPGCIPFGFMFEDANIEAQAAQGNKIVTTDGGNALFLEHLKKYKLAIKEGDSDEKIRAKQNLIDAQVELLKGIDEGITVNDSIRAAYEFRVKAAETRDNMISAIKELHADGHDVATTRELLKEANARLADEGIIPINEESVIPDEDLEAAEAAGAVGTTETTESQSEEQK